MGAGCPRAGATAAIGESAGLTALRAGLRRAIRPLREPRFTGARGILDLASMTAACSSLRVEAGPGTGGPPCRIVVHSAVVPQEPLPDRPKDPGDPQSYLVEFVPEAEALPPRASGQLERAPASTASAPGLRQE